MAAIDYGAVVFRNGERMYEDEMFPAVQINGLTFQFYKYWCEVSNGQSIFGVAGWEAGTKKVAYYQEGGVRFRIKEICPRVLKFQASFNGDHFTVIYGYGIDHDMHTWDRIKVQYLGKERARAVDREFARAYRRG